LWLQKIYTKPKGAQFGSGGFFVNTSMVSSPVSYDSYICGDCGLFQTFVSDEKKLGEVKQKWTKTVES
jgi:hypothetical protein